MKIIILAAGSSTRLGNLTTDLPKGLLEINSKSIIGHQIELFKKYNISDITIITGPNEANFKFQNVNYIHDENYLKHDVLGSMISAKNVLNDDLIFSYSDILFDEQIFESILTFNGDIGIGVDLNWRAAYDGRTNHPLEQADNVLLENKKILKIKKNILEYKSTQQLGEFIGIIKFSKKGCQQFVNKYDELKEFYKGPFQDAPSFEKAYLTDLLQEFIDSKVTISPIIVNGKWIEIDTPQDLEKAKKIFF